MSKIKSYAEDTLGEDGFAEYLADNNYNVVEPEGF
jgi:hypothetical protein